MCTQLRPKRKRFSRLPKLRKSSLETCFEINCFSSWHLFMLNNNKNSGYCENKMKALIVTFNVFNQLCYQETLPICYFSYICIRRHSDALSGSNSLRSKLPKTRSHCSSVMTAWTGQNLPNLRQKNKSGLRNSKICLQIENACGKSLKAQRHESKCESVLRMHVCSGIHMAMIS